jgi:hypothetical protein
MRIPAIEDLRHHSNVLASMVASTSWLPNPDTVKAFPGAVFPTSRYKKNHERFSHIEANGAVIGMYDDNATPEWAMFWAHGLEGSRPQGWTIAHVWPASDDVSSYTHIANLVMVPEPFASLTDKGGSLTTFLRWHAWHIYGWKPRPESNPTKPDGYEGIEWRYLTGVDDPRGSIRRQIHERDNQRTRILRPIMEGRGML